MAQNNPTTEQLAEQLLLDVKAMSPQEKAELRKQLDHQFKKK